MPKRPQCKICQKSFQTNAQLVKHSVSSNHGADRCCVPCSRIFGTPESLETHSKSSIHIKTPSVRLGPAQNPPKISHSSSPPVTPRKPECTICHRSFETNAQLAEHCLHLGHAEDRCCEPCLRLFGTKQALEAHEKTLACKGSTRQGTKISTPSPQQKTSISCRGNEYRFIPQKDRITVLEKLLSQCHSTGSLRRHGYKTLQPGGSQQQHGPMTLTRDMDGDILPLPEKDCSRSTRKAVAIDCEMVGVAGGASELVSLSVIDFLTGEQVINSLVKPRKPVRDWRTNIHGISPAVMAMARAKGQTLDGWQSARNELFKHVDEDTVLVGHALHHDLAVLHVQPARVVDSQILVSDAVSSGTNTKSSCWGLGLKDICSGLLGLNIRQNGPVGSSKAHDASEDALASREVVLCCLEQPSTYNIWLAEKREAFSAAQARKALKKRQKTRKERLVPKPKEYEEDSEVEILRWEDVIDWEVWPKSP
ncbi:hypothetical protein KVR01_009551 [Diaporthe batatas]|uniref:uncharacterized protein n=1 Tax=Diaporthe batatas TaxID=748121 RepID=UPI001D049B00|nr:uncharacterized protein KVR01_009551 [Diaporthe batatas]KAG8161287.1 hypothetical protein KVR01_009551 [Diaporthe batatas]